MSKKDKSKFRKLIKAQLAKDLAQAQKEIQPGKPAAVIVSDTITPVAPSAAAVTIAPATFGEINLPQIKYDLKKTAIVVGSIAVIMGIIYYLDLKYGILVTFGNWLFKVLHIQ